MQRTKNVSNRELDAMQIDPAEAGSTPPSIDSFPSSDLPHDSLRTLT
jgi:hypothetical protein